MSNIKTLKSNKHATPLLPDLEKQAEITKEILEQVELKISDFAQGGKWSEQ
jgi:hypothetical protein